MTTQIGDDRFTAFATRAAKSRRNFLEILRAGREDYAVNAEALAYMREHGVAGPVIDRLAAHPSRRFADRASWRAHLEVLGLTALKVAPDAAKLATEGALWGSLRAHGWRDDTVIVSDDAGQFRVGRHALCWVHAERLVHQLIATRLGGGSRCIRTAPPRRVLIPFNERQRRAVDLVRQLIKTALGAPVLMLQDRATNARPELVVRRRPQGVQARPVSPARGRAPRPL